jgi:NADPH:quinone reductase-like Zn-dependent oxidoreductase
MPVPHSVDAAAAATLPTGLMTEHGAVERSGLAPGDSVLITAATSGIGLLGIQVARRAGARVVIGTTRNPARRALLERAGAAHVIVTTADDLAAATRELTDGSGADVVLDHVGGDTLDKAIQAARVGGSVVSVGRLAGGTASLDLFALARRQVLLQSVSYGPSPPSVIGDLLDEVTTRLLPAVADGTIKPFVDQTYAFDQLAEGLARLREGQAEGKIVLTLT